MFQFETELRAERQRDGIENAKARGVPFGRRKALTRPQIAVLRAGRQHGTPMRDFRISKATVYRYLEPGTDEPGQSTTADSSRIDRER